MDSTDKIKYISEFIHLIVNRYIEKDIKILMSISSNFNSNEFNDQKNHMLSVCKDIFSHSKGGVLE